MAIKAEHPHSEAVRTLVVVNSFTVINLQRKCKDYLKPRLSDFLLFPLFPNKGKWSANSETYFGILFPKLPSSYRYLGKWANEWEASPTPALSHTLPLKQITAVFKTLLGGGVCLRLKLLPSYYEDCWVYRGIFQRLRDAWHPDRERTPAFFY